MPQSVIVYRFGAVGDLIVTFPVLQAIRAMWPDARITLVAPREVGELAVASGWADRLLSPDSSWVAAWYAGKPERLHSALGDSQRFLAFVRDEDGALGQTARAAGIAEVITRPPFPPDGSSVHMSDYALSALEAWGIHVQGLSPVVRPTTEMILAGRAVLADADINPDTPYVVVHTGSSSANKNWPSLPLLVSLVQDRTGLTVVSQRGPVEAERGIAGAWPNWAPLVGPLSLATLTGLIARARAYIGNDTGPSHLAAALAVPTITVFRRLRSGGTNATLWAPRGPHAMSALPQDDAEWPATEEVFALVAHALGL